MDIFCTNSFRVKSQKRNEQIRTYNKKASSVIYDVLTSHFALVTLLVLYSVVGAGIFLGITKLDDFGYVWSFGDSWYYTMTILTTIGYGNLCQTTGLGRGITMIYALFGIPLFFTTVLDVGICCSNGIRCLQMKIRRAVSKNIEKEDQSESYISAAIACIITVVYMLLGALMFVELEKGQKWTYMESLYFVFASLASIGFGDLYPQSMNYIVVYWIYIVVGQILVAMAVVCFVRTLLKTRDESDQKVSEVENEI